MIGRGEVRNNSMSPFPFITVITCDGVINNMNVYLNVISKREKDDRAFISFVIEYNARF